MAARAPRASTPARSRAIPAALHAPVLQRLQATDPETLRTHTCREVASWLAQEHGCHVSSRTVARLRQAAERHSDAQIVAALRETLRNAVAPAKARLSRASRRLDELARKSRSVKDLAAATNAFTRALHELAALSGVAAPAQVDLTTAGSPLAFYLPQKRNDGDGSG